MDASVNTVRSTLLDDVIYCIAIIQDVRDRLLAFVLRVFADSPLHE